MVNNISSLWFKNTMYNASNLICFFFFLTCQQLKALSLKLRSGNVIFENDDVGSAGRKKRVGQDWVINQWYFTMYILKI